MRLKILPPGLFLMFMVVMIGSHYILPIEKFILRPYSYVGVVLVLSGLVFVVWPDAIFKKSKTTIKPYEDPAKLITVGPFRVSRHPTYLGMVGVLLGAAVVLGSVTPFVFPFLFAIVVDTFYIRFEEKRLEAMFGEQYRQYRQKVRRWV